jgi:hypothetical protein
MTRSIFLALTLAAAPLLAQSTDPVVHNTADLDQREAKLLAAPKASPGGVAFDTFDDFGSYKTLLIVRVHTGDAELHEQWADQMIITKGTITLVTGGTMQGGHTTPPERHAAPASKAAKKSSSTPATSPTSPPTSPTGSNWPPIPPPPT